MQCAVLSIIYIVLYILQRSLRYVFALCNRWLLLPFGLKHRPGEVSLRSFNSEVTELDLHLSSSPKWCSFPRL